MAKTKKTYVARDPVALGASVILWQRLLVAASAVDLICQVYRFNALGRLPPATPLGFFDTPTGLEQVDLVTGLASLPLLVVLLVSGFLTLKWIYRVTMNSHTLSDGARVSPPWAIGWYFVPIANLFKPFQAIADAWKISLDPRGWRELKTPRLLLWWWGIWLVAQAMDNFSLRQDLRSDSVGDAQVVAGADILSAMLWIPLSLLLVRIVRRLSAQQSATLGAQAFS